jgi:hypothetical protein
MFDTVQSEVLRLCELFRTEGKTKVRKSDFGKKKVRVGGSANIKLFSGIFQIL